MFKEGISVVMAMAAVGTVDIDEAIKSEYDQQGTIGEISAGERHWKRGGGRPCSKWDIFSSSCSAGWDN